MFQRSPVLSGLLRYLIDETIAGRAKTLKSFIVAVDALGRKQDFDSASDSSARVQMGRLRKTLEIYYAQNAPSAGGCIYLLRGSYVVHLDSRELAYPKLPPLQNAQESSVGEDAAHASQQAGSAQTSIPFYRRSYVLPFLILLVISLVAAAAYFTLRKPAAVLVYSSPILEIIPIDPGKDPQAGQTSRRIASLLADDLNRFKISRVRIGTGPASSAERNDGTHVYRLYSRLVTDEDDVTLYLNIDDAQADIMIWSRIVILPPEPEKMRATLMPIMGEINGAQGVIASYEAVQTRDRNDGGYPCLLKYFDYARYHGDILEDKVAACLAKPVLEPHIRATMLGVRALFEMERKSAAADIDAAYARSIQFARAAIIIDPNDSWANFAVAYLSYIKKDCPTARLYTQRTMAANPNSPVFSPVLAGFAPSCDYPDAEKLLDQALQTQSPYFAKSRLYLVLAAISQNRPEKIDDIYEAELPLSRYNRSNFYLTEAMIAASKGQRAEATRYWDLFEATTPRQSKTADDKLRTVIIFPVVRQRIIQYLRDAGVTIS
jgi:tetratricopeptide (TPR) repeat protein